eukprot:GHVQ01019553.1.p2 GENE.GHVQ01019553.1~~GHVQ01019553.1.p2  ORF type:complete len:135 (-),score=16.35 GHVQ01019553.1:298-702(-)
MKLSDLPTVGSPSKTLVSVMLSSTLKKVLFGVVMVFAGLGVLDGHLVEAFVVFLSYVIWVVLVWFSTLPPETVTKELTLKTGPDVRTTVQELGLNLSKSQDVRLQQLEKILKENPKHDGKVTLSIITKNPDASR